MADDRTTISGTTRCAPTASSSSSTRRPTRGARPAVRADGLHRGGEAPQQERAALSPGRDQLHRQRGTGELRAVVRARARPSICAIAFRVGDAAHAYRTCVANGAWGVEAHPGPMELAIPAIKGIGDSLIYLVDRYARDGRGVSIYDIDFVPLPGVDPNPVGAGSPRSTTSRTTSIAGAWTSGRTSTSACSTSARCATSTSRASSRD